MEYKNSLEQIKESIKHGKLEEKIGYHFFDKESLLPH